MRLARPGAALFLVLVVGASLPLLFRPVDAMASPGGAAPVTSTTALLPTPTIVRAIAGSARVSLSWTSEEAGGSVTGYRVYADRAWLATLGDDGPAANSYVATGLTNGTTVAFQVSERRDGRWSPLSAPVAATPAPRHPFVDVAPSDADAVSWLVAPGDAPGRPIATGVTGNRFRPWWPASRVSAGLAAYRYAGLPDTVGLPPHDLRDVPSGLDGVVRWLATDPDGDGPRRPLMAGNERGRFRPSAPITRGQLAALMFGLAGSPLVPEPSAFRDVGESLDDAVSWATANGVMTPATRRWFLPGLPANRSDVARALHRLETWRAEQAVVRIPLDWWRPAPDSTPAFGNYVHVESAPGDPVGAGVTSTNTPVNARLSISGSGDTINLRVTGDRYLVATIRFPAGSDPGRVAPFDPIGRYSAALARVLADDGVGRSCQQVYGWLAVDHIRWAPSGDLDELELRFEQRCDDPARAPLRVEVRYDADDPMYAPTAPTAIPAGLWSPEPSGLPASGNWISLVGSGDTGTFSGGRVFTPLDTRLGVTWSDERLGATIESDVRYRLETVLPSPALLRPGFYETSWRNGQINPTIPVVHLHEWNHVCTTTRGWVAVDHVAFGPDGALEEIDLRFEQYCNGRSVLHGALRYDIDDPLYAPPGPEAIPDTLWNVPTDLATPPGNWAYFDAPLIGSTNPITSFSLTGTTQPTFSGQIIYLTSWSLKLIATDGGPMREGWYRREPGHPRTGDVVFGVSGMSICQVASSWFAVDHVVLGDGGRIDELDVRFMKLCSSNGAQPQYGAVHFRRGA